MNLLQLAIWNAARFLIVVFLSGSALMLTLRAFSLQGRFYAALFFSAVVFIVTAVLEAFLFEGWNILLSFALIFAIVIVLMKNMFPVRKASHLMAISGMFFVFFILLFLLVSNLLVLLV
jgi:hypothetical protein